MSPTLIDPGETRTLGRTRVRVTRLGFGGAPLGNLFRPIPEPQAVDTVRAAWNAGVRYFDTAPLYGHGLSERRIGVALRGQPRDTFVLSTKVGRRLVPQVSEAVAAGAYVDTPPVAPVFDYTAASSAPCVTGPMSWMNATSARLIPSRSRLAARESRADAAV